MKNNAFFLLVIGLAMCSLQSSASADGFGPTGLREAGRFLGIGWGDGYHSQPCPPNGRRHYQRVTGQISPMFGGRATNHGGGYGHTGAPVYPYTPNPVVSDQTYASPQYFGGGVQEPIVHGSQPTYGGYQNQNSDMIQAPSEIGDDVIHDLPTGPGSTHVAPSTRPQQGNGPSDADQESDADNAEPGDAIEPYDEDDKMEKLPPAVEELPAKKISTMPEVPEPPTSYYDDEEARLELLDPYQLRSAGLPPTQTLKPQPMLFNLQPANPTQR